MNKLILTNDENYADKYLQRASNRSENIIIASDNYNIHNLYGTKRNIIHMEKTISLFDVSDDVIRITDEVNQWFKKYSYLYNESTKGLVYFLRHVEGGKTTQRMQDICILVKSYTAVLEEHRIDSIVVVGTIDPFTTNVLIQVAEHMNIPVEFENSMLWVLIPLEHLKQKGYDYLYLIREIVHLIKRKLLIGLSATKQFTKKGINSTVAIQMCGDGNKHYGHIEPLLSGFTSIGLSPTIITWNASDSARKFEKNKCFVIQLERYISIKNLLLGIFGVISLTNKIHHNKDGFMKRHPIEYRGINLNKLLWPSMVHLIMAKLFSRIMQRKALRYILQYNTYNMIKPWGAQALSEGRIFVEEAKRVSDPILISYEHGIAGISPYFDRLNTSTYQFLNGNIEKDIYINNYKMAPDYLIPVGQVRYSGLKEFRKNYSKEDSKNILGIDSKYDFTIAIDFPIFSRGSQSYIELMSLVKLIKNLALRSQICILVKPHPGSDKKVLNRLFPGDGSSQSSNIIIVDKGNLPYHTLNACDILITKYSAVGIEAMIFKKIVISMLYDNEAKRKLYGGGAEYFLNNESALEYLDNILKPGFIDQERARSEKAQIKFLKDYFYSTDIPVNRLVAMHCKSLINDNIKSNKRVESL